MKTFLKLVVLSSAVALSAPAFAQETGRGDTVLTNAAFNDGVTTIDSLNIDTDIAIEGGVYMQRSAAGSIATTNMMDFDAAQVDINTRVRVKGDTNIGDEAKISEANIHLQGDMGTVALDTKYKREGAVQLAPRTSLNMGNVVVSR